MFAAGLRNMNDVRISGMKINLIRLILRFSEMKSVIKFGTWRPKLDLFYFNSCFKRFYAGPWFEAQNNIKFL